MHLWACSIDTIFVTHEKWSLSREAEDGLEEKDSSSPFSMNSSPLVKKKKKANDMDGYQKHRWKMFSPRIPWDLK